jgi:hypothetical protein
MAISMIGLLLTVGLVVLLLYPIRRVGGFTARTWVVVLSTVGSMLVYEVLFKPRLGGGGLWGPLDPNSSRAAPKRAPSAKTAASIFVSYRRTDSADVTGRIYDRLTEHFGREASSKMSIPYRSASTSSNT